MKLAAFSSDRHDRRREYEWKVTLGLWAVILTAILSLKSTILPWWIIPMVTIPYAFFWLRGLWVANQTDKDYSLHYVRQAQSLLAEDPSLPAKAIPIRTDGISALSFWFGFLRAWSFQFQLTATILLLVAAWILVRPEGDQSASSVLQMFLSRPIP